jgi:hypothetical protein
LTNWRGERPGELRNLVDEVIREISRAPLAGAAGGPVVQLGVRDSLMAQHQSGGGVVQVGQPFATTYQHQGQQQPQPYQQQQQQPYQQQQPQPYQQQQPQPYQQQQQQPYQQQPAGGGGGGYDADYERVLQESLRISEYDEYQRAIERSVAEESAHLYSSRVVREGAASAAGGSGNGGGTTAQHQDQDDYDDDFITHLPDPPSDFPRLEDLSEGQLIRLLRDDIALKSHMLDNAQTQAEEVSKFKEGLRKHNEELSNKNQDIHHELLDQLALTKVVQHELGEAHKAYTERLESERATYTVPRANAVELLQQKKNDLQRSTDETFNNFREGEGSIHDFKQRYKNDRSEFFRLKTKMKQSGISP